MTEDFEHVHITILRHLATSAGGGQDMPDLCDFVKQFHSELSTEKIEASVASLEELGLVFVEGADEAKCLRISPRGLNAVRPASTKPMHPVPDREPLRPPEEVGRDVGYLGGYLDAMMGLADAAFLVALDGGHDRNEERIHCGLAEGIKAMAEKARDLAEGYAGELQGLDDHPERCRCDRCRAADG